MYRFTAKLVAGRKPPYDTWAFAIVPEDVRARLGGGARIPVTGTVAGESFRATISKGDGRYRFAVTRAVRDAAGVDVGDRVEIQLEVDRESREVEVPVELRVVLDRDDLWSTFESLPPAHRRAWAQHVGEAKKPETRERRAARAPEAIRSKLFPGQ